MTLQPKNQTSALQIRHFKIKFNGFDFYLNIDSDIVHYFKSFFIKHFIIIAFIPLLTISVSTFVYFYQNGLGLAYNDARSHLDIARRVVEGLKTGAAQLGSVWLPLPHALMIPTIWNDFFWHTGLSGALVSMIGFLITNIIIILYLRELKSNILGYIVGVVVFTFNWNILYLQSTAMTELLLLATMMLGSYELLIWTKHQNILNLIKAAFFIMLSTLIRYDGWFLLVFSTLIVLVRTSTSKKLSKIEGVFVLFCTLAFFGVFFWFLWNFLIFKDPLYFAFGPYSAKAQQDQLEHAGNLLTKRNIPFSIQTYFYALIYNQTGYFLILSFVGVFLLWIDRKTDIWNKIGSLVIFSPLIFNILALYLGHSVLYVQGLHGNSWFNVRYGIMLAPTIAIFTGYLVSKSKYLKEALVLTICLVLFFFLKGFDAVTIDDARVGASQKNVSQVSGYLKDYASSEKGFILISAASHDAIIFSSGMPMGRFIHEGTDAYWKQATTTPEKWARWIVLRTYDDNDLTYKLIKNNPGFKKYILVRKYPFADVYELKSNYLKGLITDPILKH